MTELFISTWPFVTNETRFYTTRRSLFGRISSILSFLGIWLTAKETSPVRQSQGNLTTKALQFPEQLKSIPRLEFNIDCSWKKLGIVEDVIKTVRECLPPRLWRIHRRHTVYIVLLSHTWKGFRRRNNFQCAIVDKTTQNFTWVVC